MQFTVSAALLLSLITLQCKKNEISEIISNNADSTENLKEYWDTKKVLNNPHKGWFHHYYDDGTWRYLGSDASINSFPGLDHLYLRLGWSNFEPEEDQYEWHLIDELAAKWTPKGIKLGIMITTHETGLETWATPEWVSEKGAQGVFVDPGWGTKSWEPDYGDSIFLHHYEDFIKAFAARYNDSEWLVYFDIGSYGDWGEGHTSFGSKKAWPMDVVKHHIAMHTRYFKKNVLLTISEDWAFYDRNESQSQQLIQYIATI